MILQYLIILYNNFAIGLNIIPIAYSSEVIKKLTSPHSTETENEISRRFGFSSKENLFLLSFSLLHFFYLDRNKQTDNHELNSKDESHTSNKPVDYNDIITDYISKFLDPKSVTSKSNPQPTNQINRNNIKMFDVNMKSAPFIHNNGILEKENQAKPKFKIIKEFRVTLDDLKKLKLAPFVLPPKSSNKPNKSYFGDLNLNGSGSSSRNNKPYWSNFSLPASASSFRPVVSDKFPENRAEFIRSNVFKSPRRMGDLPLPKHMTYTMPRYKNVYSRRRQDNTNYNSIRDVKSTLSGISPPNFMFGKDSKNTRMSEPFRFRSANDQAFF